MVLNKVVLDSSVLIAYYNADDSQSKKALDTLTKLQKNPILILLHPLVLIETLTVLKIKTDRKIVNHSKNELFNQELFIHEPATFEVGPDDPYFDLFNRKNDLSLTDCILLLYCLDNNCRLLTFDKKLENAYKKTKALINKLN